MAAANGNEMTSMREKFIEPDRLQDRRLNRLVQKFWGVTRVLTDVICLRRTRRERGEPPQSFDEAMTYTQAMRLAARMTEVHGAPEGHEERPQAENIDHEETGMVWCSAPAAFQKEEQTSNAAAAPSRSTDDDSPL